MLPPSGPSGTESDGSKDTYFESANDVLNDAVKWIEFKLESCYTGQFESMEIPSNLLKGNDRLQQEAVAALYLC